MFLVGHCGRFPVLVMGLILRETVAQGLTVVDLAAGLRFRATTIRPDHESEIGG